MAYINNFNFKKDIYNQELDKYVPTVVHGLELNTLNLPKISDIINLLEEAKKQFGDVTMMIEETGKGAGGFNAVYLMPQENFPTETYEATCNFLF